MTRRPTRLNHVVHVVWTFAIALAVGPIAPAVAADEGLAPATRVRSDHPRIARLIALATAGSATFRREIDAINATDGLLYVHEGYCGHGVLACLAMTVDLAGPSRLLRVKLDLRRPERDTMAAIGHELQHALEVLNDPNVTNNVKMVFFYQQVAPTGSGRFETDAAIRAGEAVFRELRAKTL